MSTFIFTLFRDF